MRSRAGKIGAGIAVLVAGALGVAAIAGATAGSSGELSGATGDRASAAALKAVGAGTVTAMELDDEKGAKYEVEVRKIDGSTVDVRLDASYGVVAVDSDSEQQDEQGDDGPDDSGE